VAVGFVVMVGWCADVAILKSVAPVLASMKVNTALSFVLSGCSLVLAGSRTRGGARPRVGGLATALVVVLVALLTLAEYALAVDFGMDQLFVRDSPNSVATPFPGRMAFITALTFLLVGTALLLLHAGRAPLVGQAFTVAAFLLAFLCCLSYLYGVTSLQAVAPFSSVAVHTAVAFLVVSFGLLAAAPDRGLSGLLASEGVGGSITRQLLPAALVVPVLIGALRLAGQRAGWYGTEFGAALSALSSVVFCGGLVCWTALAVQRAEARRKIADDALSQSERRYRLLLEGVPQLVWTCSPDGRCDYLSRQWVEYTGLPEAAGLGLGWLEVVHPDDRPGLLGRWEQSARTGGPFDVEFRLRGGSGGYRWFKTRAVLFRDEGGAEKWFGTNTDIDDRKRAEVELHALNANLESRVAERTRALRESEARFRAIFHAQFQFIGLLSPSGVVLEANEAALSAAGASKESVIGRPFWETVWWAHDPAQQGRLREAVARAASGRQVRFEASHPTSGGGLMWVDFSLTPFHDEGGDVVLLIPEGRDVTERKRAEEALRAQEERYRGLLEDQTEVVCRFRADGTILFVNAVYCRTFGRSAGELVGARWAPVAHPDDVPRIEAELAALSAGRPIVRVENRVFDAAGRVRWMEFVNRGFFGPGGELVEVQSVGRDVTDRRQVEEKLRKSLDEKEVLLKEIHHRVKNNLQIVSTLLDLQSEHTADPGALEMFRESRGRVRSMALIHERLYGSQDMARVNFAEYVRRLADDLYRTYKTTGDRVRLEVDVDIPPLPVDVAIPCGLILNELLSNCFKHAFAGSAGGSVRVALRWEDGCNVLVVADTGSGFPPGLDFRDTTSFGLQLVNTLVRQLHGGIDLAAGRGTTFTIRFPTARGDRRQESLP
jgi:PAS domain S-box-containing protein